MSHVGKIFDNTPSGKILANRRDIALQKCKDNGHTMSEIYTHIKSNNHNYLKWTCSKCNHTMVMDFLHGGENGGAMIHVCRGTNWL